MREIRRLNPDDLRAAQAVRSAAFGQPADQEAADARIVPLLPHMLGAFENGRLASVATMLPYETFLAGSPRPFGGLAGVATAPEARRRGHVGALIRAWFAELHRDGVGFSGEFPFDHAFYTRYGYQTAPRGGRLEVPISRFAQQLKAAGHEGLRPDAESIDPFDPRIAALHEGFSARFDFARKRNRDPAFDSWSRALTPYWDAENRYTYLLDGGYLSVKLGDDDVVTVRDFAYSHPLARWRIVAFVAALEGDYDKVRLFLPPSDPLLVEWQADFSVRQTVYQLRVVDLESALAAYSSEHEDELRVRLFDDDCPWNDGLFDVALSPAGCRVTRAPAGAASADVTLDVRALVLLLTGAVPADALLAAGQVEGERAALASLGRLRDGRVCFLPDADAF